MTVYAPAALRVLSLWLVLCLATPAFADNTADEADVAFDLGNDAFSKRDYRGALSSYFLSYRLVPNRNVLFNIARCYEAMGEFDESYRYWHDLSTDPGLPEKDKPEVERQLARLTPKVALLRITSTPPGADVLIDREDLGSYGVTPRTVAVPAGAHTIILRKTGFHSSSAKVKATAGQETEKALTLERIVGRVKVEGTPEGATIKDTSSGEVLGTLPGTVSLTPGQHIISIQAPGHVASQLLLDVKGDEEASAKVELAVKPEASGKVVITANQESALVIVDGKESGFTPTVLTLGAGDHKLEVTLPDLEPYKRTITVEEDQEQKVEAELRYVPPKVESASRTALSIDDAPASVTILTRDELLAFGYQTLPEALRHVRGLFFSDDRLYNYGGIRGFAPPGDFNTRLLVLFDGHSFNDVYAGQGYLAHDFDVDLSEVERIEVVRGPASLLFGTGAVFGIINVVPRARTTGQYIDGVAGGGAQGAFKVRATGRLANDEASLLVSAAFRDAAGAQLTKLEPLGTVEGLDRERTIATNAKAKWNGFTLSGKWNQRKKQIPTAVVPAQFGVPGTQYDDARGYAELKYEKEWPIANLMTRIAYDGTRFRGLYGLIVDEQRTTLADDASADWLSAELRTTFHLTDTNNLTAGVEGQAQFIGQHSAGLSPQKFNRFVFAASLMDEWKITDWLALQGGLRLDKYNDIAEVALAPRIAAVIKPYQAGVTKVVVGRAFRAPSIYELFYTDNNLTQRVPRGLTPELITTFEVEHSHDFNSELRLTVGAYLNLIDRLLIQVSDPPGTQLCGDGTTMTECLVFTNQPSQVQAIGAEAQVRWQPGRYALVEAQYSFVILTGPNATDASSYPMHLGSVRGMLPIKQKLFRLTGEASFQSGRRASDGHLYGEALVMNVGVSGEFTHFRYFAGVRNLLDAQPLISTGGYTVVPFVPEYGRTFWFELGANF